jgi:hypothetical protein
MSHTGSGEAVWRSPSRVNREKPSLVHGSMKRPPVRAATSRSRASLLLRSRISGELLTASPATICPPLPCSRPWASMETT